MGIDLKRLPDSHLRLIQWAASEMGWPFCWGETNCVALAMRAIDAQCGSDLIGKHRHHMASERRATAWVRRHGVDGLAAVLLSDGLQQIDAALLLPGDIGIAPWDGSIAASVFLGKRFLSSTLQDGVGQFSAGQLVAPAIFFGVR